MARPLFTQEHVFEVADEMSARGQEVTALALLSKLGGGSLTTIYKHLLAWREARHLDATPSQNQTIPDNVQTAFGTALGQIWRTVSAEASKQVDSIKEKAAEDLAAANKQFTEALQVIERLEGEAETNTTQIETLTTKLSDLTATLQKAETEKAALKATTEELKQQLKSQETQIDRLHQDLEAERKRSDKAEQLIESTRTAKETAITEAAELRGQIQSLKSQNTELFTKLEAEVSTRVRDRQQRS
jgi:colicin import membrane protein